MISTGGQEIRREFVVLILAVGRPALLADQSSLAEYLLSSQPPV
jgi:hypothetical protein